MSEFKLPSELLNGAEVTLEVFEEVQKLADPDEVEKMGDPEAYQEVLPDIHHFEEKVKCAEILLYNLEEPTWETVVWGHSFGCKDGQAEFEAIGRAINNIAEPTSSV